MLDAELLTYIAGAGFNLAVALVIVRLIYYPVTQDKQYVLTFLTFSTMTYFVLGLLTSIDLSIGVGFGLFAIFSILRYRTDTMPAREMTYLFVFIALPVMNSVLTSSADFVKMAVANAMVIAVLFALEKEWGFHFEASKKIIYDKIELITPDRRPLLLADLRARTGLPIRRVRVGRLDFVRDTADLIVAYDEPAEPAGSDVPAAAEIESEERNTWEATQ